MNKQTCNKCSGALTVEPRGSDYFAYCRGSNGLDGCNGGEFGDTAKIAAHNFNSNVKVAEVITPNLIPDIVVKPKTPRDSLPFDVTAFLKVNEKRKQAARDNNLQPWNR